MPTTVSEPHALDGSGREILRCWLRRTPSAAPPTPAELTSADVRTDAAFLEVGEQRC